MRSEPGGRVPLDLFSAEEIALAAGVDAVAVREVIGSGRVISYRRLVASADAAELVSALASGAGVPGTTRAPLTPVTPPRRRTGASILASGLAHGAGVLLLGLAATLGAVEPNDTETTVRRPVAHLVSLTAWGPGGGGGGDGLGMPALPQPAAEVSVGFTLR